MNNIIFISGLSVPNCLGKTKYVWNDKLWKNYNRCYLRSYIPVSDFAAYRKLNELSNLINSLENPILIGQSLGSWWAANLVNLNKVNIKKLILLTPLVSVKKIPFINVSVKLNPLRVKPNLSGPDKVLVCHGKYDMLCPTINNSYQLIKHFNAMEYAMNGGHFFQTDHEACLRFMQDWIDII